MKTVSIINLKGGTGKTVTACNLTAEMAVRGCRVLTIDADPQHNTTSFWAAEYESLPTVSDVMAGRASLTGAVQEFEIPEIGTVSVVPADMSLVSLDVSSLLGGGSGIDHLADGLRQLRDSIDFAVIDCPPSFTAASVAAISVSDAVIIPVTADAYALEGLGALIGQIVSIRGKDFPCFVLLTRANRSRVSRQMEAAIRSHHGCVTLRTTIPQSVKVPESTFARQALRVYAPGSPAAYAYGQLAEEVMEVMGDE